MKKLIIFFIVILLFEKVIEENCISFIIIGEVSEDKIMRLSAAFIPLNLIEFRKIIDAFPSWILILQKLTELKNQRFERFIV